MLICDDAMQHRQIFRDINLVLLDSQTLQRNNYILPRGKLREPITGLKRASAFVLTRANEEQRENKTIGQLAQAEKIPVFMSTHTPKDIVKGDYSEQWPIAELKGKKVCAFCGIAKPDSFKKTLLDAGAQILSFDIFPDHHRFNKNELGKIKAKFIDYRADLIITTQKDGMRVQEFPEFSNMIYLLRIEMEFIPSSESFENFILDRLAIAQNNG